MWIEILLFFLAAFLLLYRYITKDFGYFKSRGYPEAKGTFPFGSDPMWKLMTGKLAAINFFDDIAKEFPDDKWFGLFNFRQKAICVKDMELAKLILIKDADYFTDRQNIEIEDSTNDSDKIVNMFLTVLRGEQWKKMRATVSPVFTSGKMKTMVPHIEKCALNLEELFAEAAATGEILEAKDIYGKFTLDAIATSGFGIESNSFKDPNNVFRTTALRMVRTEGYSSKWDSIKLFLLVILPKLCRLFGITMMPTGTVEFFTKIIRQTVEHRKESGIRRNDIIDLLLDELDKDKDKEQAKDNKDEFDMELALISNALIFFFAGFDTSSLSLAVTIFGFVLNPAIQDKARQEIKEVIGESEKITADQLRDLKYIDNCINEALRHYGIVHTLQRDCTRDYLIPDTNFTIPKGTSVNIYSKPYAAGCFFNADNFDPDNFSPENNPNKFGFVAFGQGPRNCIGMRYAYMAMKLAIVHTLRKFEVVKCDETPEKLEFEMMKNYFKNGVKFKVEHLKEE